MKAVKNEKNDLKKNIQVAKKAKNKKREKMVDKTQFKEAAKVLNDKCTEMGSDLAHIMKDEIPQISSDFSVSYESAMRYLRIRDMLAQRVANVNRRIGRYKSEKRKYDLLNEHKEEIYHYYKEKKDNAKENKTTYNMDTLLHDDYNDILAILNLEKDQKLRTSIKNLLRDMMPDEEKEKRKTQKDIVKFKEPEKLSVRLKDILDDPEYLDTGYKWKTDGELLGELGIEILSILTDATFDALKTHKTDELEILLRFSVAHRCACNTHSKEYTREETSCVTQGEPFEKLKEKYINALNELKNL